MLVSTLLYSYAALFIMMTILWAVGMKIKNAALVDAGWGFGYAIVALLSALLLDGHPDRQLIMAALFTIWGTRLGWHLLADRILGGKPEEGRYTDIRMRWKTHLPLKFFLFYQFQAILILVLSAPLYLISLNMAPAIGWFEWVGVGVWTVGIVGETIADRQLKRFKDEPTNKGRTCQVGLWRYSRHPNYFFEWMIWVAYCIMALPAPSGWIALVSPSAMLYVLLRVTGIPLTEAQALKSRGEEYHQYQHTTSAFVPWFRKRQPA